LIEHIRTKYEQTERKAMSTPNEPAEDARLYEHQRRVFQVHAGVFAASMALIFVVNLAINAAADITGEWWAWWSVAALLGWGLGVAIHGLVVRMSRPPSVGPA
jgi:hypothetical protein